MDSIGLQWCSKCTTFRDAQSFEKHKSGKVKKLCNRHGKKRNLDAIFDDWDDFEAQLRAWNCPVRLYSLLTFLFILFNFLHLLLALDPIRVTGIELYVQFG
jgi:hypothetical protein